MLAIGAVDLRLEEEVGIRVGSGDAAGWKRIDAAKVIGDFVTPFITKFTLCRSKGPADAIQSGAVADDSFDPVGDEERRHSRSAVVIEDMQVNFDRRNGCEQDGDRVAESDVLCALSDVEADVGFPLAGVLAPDLHDNVFQFQSG